MNQAPLILIFSTSFVVALSGAMTPGPLLALTISEAARQGFRAGPLLILGHGILEVAVVIALAKGLSEIIGSNLASGIIGVVGGMVMLGMGVIIFKQSQKQTFMLNADVQQISRSGPLVLGGIVASISNPYWTIWWATLGTTYMMWSLKQGFPGVVSFYFGHIFADLAWYSLVSVIIASGKKIMSNTVYRGLLIACGLFLLGLGGYFIASGIKFLSG